ncbi:MAG: RNA polymerase sigma factor RpoS, partial [Proteobacteria bacterium]|nr:RNA polymerase sigma factor RpoS [Pseudomonadota bacterium]
MAAPRTRRIQVARGSAGQGREDRTNAPSIEADAPADGADGFIRDDVSDAALKGLSAGHSGEGGDSLTHYLSEVRRTELFTPEEEYRCACAARAGDFTARQSMIEHNLRLVV